MSEAIKAIAAGPVEICQINSSDLLEALREGWADLRSTPHIGLGFGLLYACAGWAIVWLAAISGYYYLAYPLAAGFALVAPFVAGALYEVSRRRESKLPVKGSALIAVLYSELRWMALVSTFAFFIWIDFAVFLYAMFFGLSTPAPMQFIQQIFTTAHGLSFLLIGNLAGACIAFFIFSITVVSCPMLVDRDADFITAMIASVRAVRKNSRTLVKWAVIIAGLLLVSLATGLLALVVVLPWLGHASWHLYRRLIRW